MTQQLWGLVVATAPDHALAYVDEYAVSDPLEDLAESFAIWCAIGPYSPLLPEGVEEDPSNGASKLAWMNDPTNSIAAEHEHRCERLRTLTK
ncbi:hypothetical protein [Lapillicoccus sp.]|uniref:hypothetical protein n=1 Tax=Lapillicoccus sp. TaxID=1909287 RepID=UPI003265D431